MRNCLIAYAATLFALLLLDFLWLGVVAMDIYRQGIGHLMAASPNLAAAAAFYLIYPSGLVFFAIRPHETASSTPRAIAGRAAFFGFLAYMTYDLTNLATLRDWPLGLALIDIAWGVFASVLAASFGGFIQHRLAR